MTPSSTAPAWGVHLKLLGMTALWGASYPWAKAVTQAMPVLTAATLRFFLAALALLLWLHHLRRLRTLLALTRRQWAAMALAALWLHEALHWSLVTGGSVAFAGMVLMYLGRRALTAGRRRSAATPRR